MKMLRSLTCLGLLLATATFAQTTEKVTLKLKNNGLLPREFKFLERHPDTKEPNVFTAYILPGQSYTVKLKVGTSLAQVSQKEINATMQGQNVRGKPLLVVKSDNDGKTIQLIDK
jgi:archaellum component FlaF (FlaF/FlaG flagellin family)